MANEQQMSRNEPGKAVVDGQPVNVSTLDDCIGKAVDRLKKHAGFTLFTLNLDHLVKRRSDPQFKAAYDRATLVTADGAPVAWLARKQGARIERTAGADLVVPLCFAAAGAGLAVYLFGSSAEVLSATAETLKRIPGLEIAGMEAPPEGFDPKSQDAEKAADRIAESGATLAFVALGAPKQEMFSDMALARHPEIGFACIGAGLDFIAGKQKRAPLWMQRTGLEWFWRLATNPRRMAQRYWACLKLLGALLLINPFRGAPQPQPPKPEK